MRSRFKQLAPDLVEVPAGTVLVGSTEEQIAAAARAFGVAPEALLNEAPQHRVELPAFAIGRGPVSCNEYLAFLTATDHPAPQGWLDGEPPHGKQDHPVVGVGFNDARAYCRWLSTATGRVFRLPTEQEWERAARGDDGRQFPWGEEWRPDWCNTAAAGLADTAPIGSFAQDVSPFGCVDMGGNVAEWTGVRFRPYPGSTLAAPTQTVVALRGGSWRSGPDQARCTRRILPVNALGDPAVGFRVLATGEEF
ncbi:MAG TPA: SUMF1/EgtB/PvdO family nonheme iron enzyme [Roseiflexaceae bacterium]|nr:SUMF1/EgtB/PvdO family nonheme iron enzyme [Roseiflexaceae bacterium]